MKKNLSSLFMLVFCFTISFMLFSCSSGDVTTLTTTNVEYEVNFFGDGETLISSVSVGALEVVSLSEAPLKEHFDFVGWTDGTEIYQAGSDYMVNKDANFTPVWEEQEKYSITLLAGEGAIGTAPTISNQYAGDAIVLPSNPFSKEQCSFVGWSDGTNTYNANENYIVGKANVILRAVWEEKERYSIILLGGEGAVGTAPTLPKKYENEKLILPASPFYKNDCAFGGWSDGTNTYDVGDTLTISNSNITLNAVWLQGTEGLEYSQIDGSSTFSVSDYTGISQEIIIPEMHEGMLVTNIGVEAFDNKDQITNVSIPASIEDIGYYAFYDCDALENITIPIHNNLSNVSIEAFTDSAWYNSLPNGVVYLGTVAYCYKGTITENLNLTIKEGTTKILNGFMENETYLISLIIPDSLSSIGIAAFLGCDNLETINYSENCNVEYVGQYALLNTKWYDELSNGQTYIGKVAYCYKGEISENTIITFKEGTVCISGGGFEDSTNLVSVIIPSTVVYIQDFTFSSCPLISSLIVEERNPIYYSVDNCIIERNTGVLVQGCKTSVIPNDGSITMIGDCAFQSRRINNPEVVLPNSLETIGEYAFGSCGNMPSIAIPENVQSIGYAAFLNCFSLRKVTIDSQYIADDLRAQFGTGNLFNYALTVYIREDLDIEDQTYFLSKYSKSLPSDKVGYVMYEKIA